MTFLLVFDKLLINHCNMLKSLTKHVLQTHPSLITTKTDTEVENHATSENAMANSCNIVIFSNVSRRWGKICKKK